MTSPPGDKSREVVDRPAARRRRRMWGRWLLLAVGTAIALAGLITGVVLATAAGEQQPNSTSSLVAQVTSTEKTTTTAATTPSTETTQTSMSTETSALPATSPTTWLSGRVIVIDPGHQAHADSGLEPLGPGSSKKKAKVSSGTSSVLTGIPESQVVLEIGLKLQEALTKLGITVVMTRTTQDVDVPNSQRAQIGNQAEADLMVRLHCNGSANHSIHGLFTLYPASIKGWTDDIAAVSKSAAAIMQQDLIAATGATDRGLQMRSDLTGFNWSDVPVILVEMGYMTNPTEDEQLRSGPYQDAIVQGLVQGIMDFLKTQYGAAEE